MSWGVSHSGARGLVCRGGVSWNGRRGRVEECRGVADRRGPVRCGKCGGVRARVCRGSVTGARMCRGSVAEWWARACVSGVASRSMECRGGAGEGVVEWRDEGSGGTGG